MLIFWADYPIDERQSIPVIRRGLEPCGLLAARRIRSLGRNLLATAKRRVSAAILKRPLSLQVRHEDLTPRVELTGTYACYWRLMPRHDRLSISQPSYRMSDEVAAILFDLHAPGAVTALPDDGSEHILMFRPAPGVRLRRVYLLASDIERELGAASVCIEQSGTTAELRIRLLHEVPCDG